MACHYHPERESTDVCAICGKQICKECGLEIAGKVYCKDCLQQIVGVGLENKSQEAPAQEPMDNIYAQPEAAPAAPEKPVVQEYNAIEDSPYNFKDNIEYSGGLESSYIVEQEPVQAPKEEIIPQAPVQDDGFIYPDHSYEPQPTSARLDLEDKYEKYLDDLYFDENEVPLNEQLAKDEEQYGSLTRKPYTPKEAPAPEPKPRRAETPEEMEARIRSEILREQGIEPRTIKNESIHNLNYQDEKEPMGAVDILLTIVLVIVILIVVYYLIYLFILHTSYPTFMDAVFGLKNPQNVINNVLTHK